MSKYRLFNCQPSGNCYKLRLMMHLLEIPFEKVEIDILNRESRTPEFLAINPNGRVPVLQIDEEALPESNAALWYLAQGTQFEPADRLDQARVLQWMFFEQYNHEPNIATVRFWISMLGAEDDYADQIAQKRPAGYAALDVMEDHLSSHEFFVANQFTAADMALFAYTHVAHEGGFDLKSYPHIRRWITSVESVPGFVSLTDS